MRIAVTAAAVLWILITARPLLQPIAIGLLIWLILSASTHKIAQLLPARYRRGRLTVLFGVLGLLLILFLIGLFLAGSIAEVRRNLPVYEANLDRQLYWLSGLLDSEADALNIADLVGRIDVTSFALTLAGSTAAYLAALVVVLAYTLFIFVEAQAVEAKIAALAGTEERQRRMRHTLAAVRRGIDDFLAVQVLIGVMQAVPTYALLALLGVDAPLLFAVLIFLLSFIPTIGTLVGVAFPALMTLLQFGSIGPFLLVVGILGSIQVLCSNVVAPQLMSRSLNLSPLAVLFAVFAGGATWGIVGALIAVPTLTIIAIACAEAPSLRPIAIALSADGTLGLAGDGTAGNTTSADAPAPSAGEG
jgi:predicted PurR-regulated permease PerM